MSEIFYSKCKEIWSLVFERLNFRVDPELIHFLCINKIADQRSFVSLKNPEFLEDCEQYFLLKTGTRYSLAPVEKRTLAEIAILLESQTPKEFQLLIQKHTLLKQTEKYPLLPFLIDQQHSFVVSPVIKAVSKLLLIKGSRWILKFLGQNAPFHSISGVTKEISDMSSVMDGELQVFSLIHYTYFVQLYLSNFKIHLTLGEWFGDTS